MTWKEIPASPTDLQNGYQWENWSISIADPNLHFEKFPAPTPLSLVLKTQTC